MFCRKSTKRQEHKTLASAIIGKKQDIKIIKEARAEKLLPLASKSLASNQYIPPAGIAGAAGVSSLISATRLSVVSTIAATEAAFWSAERVTFVGSTIPAGIMSP